jgi:phage gp37-like protein
MYTGYSIEEIEDAIMSTLAADKTLAGYVKTFERMPWDRINELSNILKQYPAIVVVYKGGSDNNNIYSVCDHAGVFAVLCAHKNVRSPSAAASGPVSGEKGVYAMLGDVLSALNFSKIGLDIISCISIGVRAVGATQSLTIFSREFEIIWRFTHSA